MKLSATLLLACHLASWAAAAPAPSQQHQEAPSRRDPAAAASDPELVLSIVEAAAAAAVAAPPSSLSSPQKLAPSSTSDTSPHVAESPAAAAAAAAAGTSTMEAPGSSGAPCAGSGSTYHRLRHYVDLIVVVFVAGFLVLFVVAEIGLTLYNKIRAYRSALGKIRLENDHESQQQYAYPPEKCAKHWLMGTNALAEKVV